jgi:deazaflavin-dependent oxidoreductase (nitroreductase family)
MDKRQLSTALAKYVVNPVTSRLAGYLPFWALLETTGRKSGEPRRTPVGNGLEGETFWLVAEHGRCANYIKNIMADPRVRVRVNRRWRSGVATLLPDDDPIARQTKLRRGNAQFVRLMGTDLLSVRIDLEP